MHYQRDKNALPAFIKGKTVAGATNKTGLAPGLRVFVATQEISIAKANLIAPKVWPQMN